MAIIQYPYTLKLFKSAESVYDEATGEFVNSGDEWVNHSKCRDEAGNGNKITTPDGEVYSYGTLIQLPKGTDGIKSGDKIQVVDDSGNVRFSGSVVRFSKDQLHSRIWV